MMSQYQSIPRLVRLAQNNFAFAASYFTLLLGPWGALCKPCRLATQFRQDTAITSILTYQIIKVKIRIQTQNSAIKSCTTWQCTGRNYHC